MIYMMCFDLLKLMRSLKQLRDLLGCSNLYLKMIVWLGGGYTTSAVVRKFMQMYYVVMEIADSTPSIELYSIN